MLNIDYDAIKKQTQELFEKDKGNYIEGTDMKKVYKDWEYQVMSDYFEDLFEKLFEAPVHKQISDARKYHFDHKRPPRIDFPQDGYWLYRWYNNSNEIIYVGCTENLYRRTKDHIRDNTKIKEAVKFECLDLSNMVTSRTELEWIETYFINKFHAKYNVKDNAQSFNPPPIAIYDQLEWSDITTKVNNLKQGKHIIRSNKIGDDVHNYIQSHPITVQLPCTLDELYKYDDIYQLGLEILVEDCEKFNINFKES
jgi:hypothetical protein